MTPFTILCGGQSQRMGRDKALLEYHGETLLARHLRLADAAGMRVYLASGGTDYPHPPAVQVVADALVGRAGPLSALAGALTTNAARRAGWRAACAVCLHRAGRTTAAALCPRIHRAAAASA